MIHIIGNKKYDPSNSKKIHQFYRYQTIPDGWGGECVLEFLETVYCTKKGNYFITESKSGKNETARLITKDEVKKILLELNQAALYEKLFGKLEEG